MNVEGKTQLLMESLLVYYKKEQNYKILKTITEQRASISLRLLEWFVTNYSKQYNIIIKTNTSYFNVYIDYKNQLKAYSKKLFDPFCRRTRIIISHDGENTKLDGKDGVITTVGQLNFFRWAINNNVASYVLKNHDFIEADMLKRGKGSKGPRGIISNSPCLNRNTITGVITW